mmetsp:Transcript_12307/g.32202  ORF Transcript_12307/g.32202 Transcript_12307/m.32202 type:complete len:307 (+) Transcript_12307:224-1144(+)
MTKPSTNRAAECCAESCRGCKKSVHAPAVVVAGASCVVCLGKSELLLGEDTPTLGDATLLAQRLHRVPNLLERDAAVAVLVDHVEEDAQLCVLDVAAHLRRELEDLCEAHGLDALGQLHLIARRFVRKHLALLQRLLFVREHRADALVRLVQLLVEALAHVLIALAVALDGEVALEEAHGEVGGLLVEPLAPLLVERLSVLVRHLLLVVDLLHVLFRLLLEGAEHASYLLALLGRLLRDRVEILLARTDPALAALLGLGLALLERLALSALQLLLRAHRRLHPHLLLLALDGVGLGNSRLLLLEPR